ncbi:short transient receptor potential channel 4-associated protein-like [Tubulanus polymorphus]|uniref:short transient receptor potential channel 4-associated protein-like n=1 Tax=Tubulanus polymorphus TaxID=672921 RepID=UPI003DA64CEC
MANNLVYYGKSRKRTHNVAFSKFMSAQLDGRGFKRLHQLPIHILDDLDESLDLMGVPNTIQVLDEYSAKAFYDTDECFETLKEVNTHVTTFESRQSDNVEDMNKYAKIFYEYGGVEVLIRLLMSTSIFPNESKSSRELQCYLRVKSLILQIMSKIITREIGTKVAKELAWQDDLLSYMFSLLAYKKTYITACDLIEDLLQSRRQVFNLSGIKNMRALVPFFDDEKLANFCRILAICISDLDLYENKSSLFAQNKQKRSKGFVNVRDVNQDLLLGIPDLVTRLVNIAVAKPLFFDTPRHHGVGNELDSWMEWIDRSLSDPDAERPETDDFEDFVGGISEPSAVDSPFIQQPGIKISMQLVQRVEVIYVIGLFLVGKHRKKIQRKVADLKLIPGLNDLFDHFIWKCQSHRTSSRLRLRGHNTSCECSPEVALKIQFLRLVHAFCDHSEYKHLLLTQRELTEIKKINEKAGPLKVDNLDNIPSKEMMCKGKKGLLSKIVDVMKKEPTASTFRFWLARAVESYLRGTTSYCDQVFLLRRGLLQHVAGNIVENDIRPKEILQSSFDLLGELIKFNIEAFKKFDRLLDTDAKFNKFVNTINANLVDSNMFIRSLMLSYEHFTNKNSQLAVEYSKVHEENRLLQYIGNFTRQLDYLHKLINIVNVEAITQENVSCLNTTLVFLMFANQRDDLPAYLTGLRDELISNPKDKKGSFTVMKNFRDLLLFWQDHYLHKDKDCSALERSSRISFDYWKQTVASLLSEDRHNGSAILHYLPESMIRMVT